MPSNIVRAKLSGILQTSKLSYFVNWGIGEILG